MLSYLQLRCTLIEIDNISTIKILPKKNIQLRNYSTLSNPMRLQQMYINNPFRLSKSYSDKVECDSLLNPWFITGLTDAEGSFSALVKENPKYRLGWRVDLVFQIGLHKKDLELLKLIKKFFGDIGTITTYSDMCAFRVSSPKQILEQILPHFDKYPLISQKVSDYLLFREIVMLMLQGKHLTEEGLQTIINIKTSLNLGLSEVLKAAFPKTISVPRPIQPIPVIPSPHWVVGFVSGEGTFFVKITNGRNKVGIGVQIVFQITQHVRDMELLKCFIAYFQCGQYTQASTAQWGNYLCTKFFDNYNIILPFFSQHPIQGIKAKDYLDWVKVAEMIKKKDHLTKEGASEILIIKSGMNKGRPIQ